MRLKTNIAIAGYGTVGKGVRKLLQDGIARDSGVDVNVSKILVRRPTKIFGQSLIEKPAFTTSIEEVLEDPTIDTFVEVIGGVGPALSYVNAALDAGKNVVTANKLMLSTHGAEIFEKARKLGLHVGFEASVCGSIPIIKIIREAMPQKITSIKGIVNGTTNYILTRMEEGMELESALKLAQAKGFAEADPTADVDGIDAAHKLSILASLTYNMPVTFNDVYREGIGDITALDMSFAREFGYVIKLLAVAKAASDGLELRVHPTFVRRSHQLASVRDEFNAVHIDGMATGPQTYIGRGAGQLPTANAVVADILDLARLTRGVSMLPSVNNHTDFVGMGRLEMRYYLRFIAVDKPNVLSRLSGVLGRHGISIESVNQKARNSAEAVPVLMITHKAKEQDVVNALKQIDKLPITRGKSKLIRIEDD